MAISRVFAVSGLMSLLAVAFYYELPAALCCQAEVSALAQTSAEPLINEIMAANTSAIVEPDFGEFADWIEIYNPGGEAIDLGGYTLTDNIHNPFKWPVPAGTAVPAGGYTIIWADGRAGGTHTDFSLSRDGEEVVLYDPDGTLVDMVRFGDQIEDVSYGRVADGAADWAFFQRPTPGRANAGATVTSLAQAAAPVFSKVGGRYEAPVEVALSSPSAGAEIHYTLDGSRPTADSERYEEPIELAETAVVRARVFTEGHLASSITTQPFLIGEQTSLPIVSLVTDPAYLWDPRIGIYLDDDVETRRDWERPATVTLFEPDGSLGFQAEASIRLFGTTAIYLPQKSLAVFIKDAGHGVDHLTYRLFPDRELQQYSSFILRSGSDDWAGTMLRDALGQEAVAQAMELGTQAIRPALLYVNGSYFGIYNVREKENEDFLVTHYGANLGDIDLLFVGHSHGDGGVDITTLYGEVAAYKDMVSFAVHHDLTAAENFSTLKAMLNTDHFIDYTIAESYVGNTSWHRNRKVWRAQTPLERWDFLLYDLDRGFGLKYVNTLQDIMGLDPLFGALLSNEGFRDEFIQRFAYHLNVTFAPERIVSLLDGLQEEIAPEIERHRARWQVAEWWAENYETESQITGRPATPELASWQDELAYVQEFVRERPDAVRQHLVEAFSLSGTQFLTLAAIRPEGGHVLVEGLPLPDSPFTGIYFRDVPLHVTAVAEPGYRFVSWQGPVTSSEETISLLLTSNETVTAVFEPVRVIDRLLGPHQPANLIAGLVLLVALVELLQFAYRRYRG